MEIKTLQVFLCRNRISNIFDEEKKALEKSISEMKKLEFIKVVLIDGKNMRKNTDYSTHNSLTELEWGEDFEDY